MSSGLAVPQTATYSHILSLSGLMASAYTSIRASSLPELLSELINFIQIHWVDASLKDNMMQFFFFSLLLQPTERHFLSVRFRKQNLQFLSKHFNFQGIRPLFTTGCKAFSEGQMHETTFYRTHCWLFTGLNAGASMLLRVYEVLNCLGVYEEGSTVDPLGRPREGPNALGSARSSYKWIIYS